VDDRSKALPLERNVDTFLVNNVGDEHPQGRTPAAQYKSLPVGCRIWHCPGNWKISREDAVTDVDYDGVHPCENNI